MQYRNTNHSLITRYPFLRLLLPLAVGIWLADYLFFKDIRISSEALCIGLSASFIVLLITHFVRNYTIRWFFGVTLHIFLFLLGATLTTSKLSDGSYSFAGKEMIYRAVVTGNPEYKPNSILCPSTLSEAFDSIPGSVTQKVLLYFPQDSLASTLKQGDELLFHAQISLPRNNGNPEEFDYPRYLIRKGISGTAYVKPGKWKVVSHSETETLQEEAFKYRNYVLDRYKQLGFAGDELAVLSALTVGYKDELSEEIRESFSISGASHVLALSGLHIGILFALMSFIFIKCFGSGRKASILRATITIILLWCFALITGFSPSVVRSVCMFSLIAISQVFSGKLLTINSLAVSAFCMLLYNLVWLFDVGFQLSYTAVLGIVLIQPRIFGLLNVKNKILNYLWGLITVSIAAQIATAPLVLYYFSRFSTHFLLTNLWVVLLVTIIVYVAIVMLLASPVLWLSQFIADILNTLIGVLNYSVRWIEKLPYSSIDNIWVHHWDVFVFYLALFIGLILTIRFAQKYVFALIACLLFLVSHQLWFTATELPHSNIVFYNVRNCPVVHCINNNGTSWLVCADSVSDLKHLSKTLSNYWNRRKLDTPQQILADRYEADILRQDNYLHFKGKRIYILNDDRWYGKHSKCLLEIDYLYVCKGFTKSLESIAGLMDAKCVVLDSSLPAYRINQLKKECTQLGVEYVLLNEKALIIDC
ncbi:ComEC/Rec2 family competence protein [Bacteroides sp. 519]|uniref:ComEC/Rec2 family competence protein n=1 Tax=Bacteroides sp. 519 TaxID=2302937 RepID=UPI0013D4975E|nr:ComEC/Rec2 family competence protein [Bacteroides sp. 519]NDV59067.1 ComEC family competence protein [Bacteroides sp. 519]